MPATHPPRCPLRRTVCLLLVLSVAIPGLFGHIEFTFATPLDLTARAFDLSFALLLLISFIIFAHTGKLSVSARFKHHPGLLLLACVFALFALYPFYGVMFHDAPAHDIASGFRFLQLLAAIFLTGVVVRYVGDPLPLILFGVGMSLAVNLALAPIHFLDFYKLAEWPAVYFGNGGLLEVLQHRPGSLRYHGLTSSPNELAYVALVGIALAAPLCVARNNTFSFVWLLISLLVLLLSTGRTAAFVAGAALALFLFLVMARCSLAKGVLLPKGALGLFVSSIMMALVSVSLYAYDLFRVRSHVSGIISFLQDEAQDGAVASRLSSWQTVLDVDNVLYLVGYGGRPSNLLVGATDSGWIQYFLQGGVLLTLAFLSLGTYILLKGAALVIRDPGTLSGQAGGVMLFFGTALFLGSITSTPLHYQVVWIPLFSSLWLSRIPVKPSAPPKDETPHEASLNPRS